MTPGRDYRASDADREAAAQRLHTASVEGRISAEELEQRLAGVYGAVTMAELDRLVVDVLPPPPPPAPMPGPAPGPPVPYYPPQQQYLAPAAPTNGMAIASLVAAIVWFAWLGSAMAVVFGHVALNQINASGGREQGRGLAIAGLVMGYLSLGFLLLIILGAAV